MVDSRQFHELVSIANQWRWFDDVQSTWKSVSGIIEEVGAGQPHCIDEPLSGKFVHQSTSDWAYMYMVLTGCL